MHVLYSKFSIFVTLLLSIACSTIKENSVNEKESHKKVEVRKIENKYQLFKDGQPYYIKGAGGYGFFSELKDAGGNSIRIWDTNDAKRVLDEAQQLGLTVTLGLRVLREKEGFNYDDEKAVKAQFESLKNVVIQYKDHPALLMWCIGNEVYASSKNKKVWTFLNDVAGFIHEIDPDHPTSTAIMNAPAEIIGTIKSKCPNIDILSINTYGGIPRVYNEIRSSNWDGAYIISEYGSQGYWEAPRTSWDVVIEETSNRKAETYKQRYESFISKDIERCIGSYAFFWGQKQERTSTWFNLYTEKGEKTAIVDALQYVWTGKLPANQAPYISYMLINEKHALDNIYLTADSVYTAKVFAYDTDNDHLSFSWELVEDHTDMQDGIFNQEKPQVILTSGVASPLAGNTLKFTAPKKDGPYRLFVYVSDGNKSAATANIPFYVLP